MPGPSGQGGALASIQALRGFAALWVLFYHCNLQVRQNGHSLLDTDFADLGMAGVDVFFCLSGVLMAMITAGGRGGWGPARDFASRRLRRIAPLYWLLTLVKVALLLVVGGGALAALPETGFFLRSMLFLPAVNAEGDPYPIISAGWTLVYEGFFYAVMAVAVLLQGRRAPLLAGLAVLALMAAGLVFDTGAIAAPSLIATYTDSIMLEFVLGLGIGWLIRRHPPGEALSLAAVLLALALFAAVLWPPVQTLPRALHFGLPAALLVLGCIGLERHFRGPATAWLRWAGDASYSIYLSHQIVLAVLAVAVARLAPRLLPGLPAIATDLLLFGGGFVLAVLVGGAIYHLVEKPLLRRLSRRRPGAAPVRSVQAEGPSGREVRQGG